MKFESVLLGDVCELIAGFAFKSKDFETGEGRVIKITHITPPVVDMDNLAVVNLQSYNLDKIEKYIAGQGDFVLAMTGATIGKIGRIEKGSAYINQRVLMFKNHDNIDKDYLYYVLQQYEFEQYVLSHIDSQSAQPNISAGTIGKYEFDLPDLNMQKKIGKFLRLFDAKIELNNKINNNLYEQVKALYSQMFVNICNDNRPKCRMEDFFDISIGKTPPRKESQWFSNSSKNRVWVSISDMGNAELYISNSSEYLTHEAVDKFNVKIIPDNTVILSFKLTVGRVAITDGEITTNEAIAHFKTNKAEINEYLYCYLKDFNYQTMGSTSSIATAVNSKIIKAMPFVIPTEDELNRFHDFAAPIFGMIKNNQRENVRMAIIRDTLLPKLMSGELDVTDIDI